MVLNATLMKIINFFKKSKESKIDLFLKRNCTLPIHKSLPNIRQALSNVLSRLPDCVFEDLIQIDDPVVIVDVPGIAGSTSFYQQRNKFRIKKGIRIVMLRAELNDNPIEAIMGIIAHELAHVYVHVRSDKEVPWANIESNKLVGHWGFDKELMMASKMSKPT